MEDGRRTEEKRVVVNVRSDSKTSVEQLQGISEVRDSLMPMMHAAIRNLLDRMSNMIIFKHLDRTHNIAGLLLVLVYRKAARTLPTEEHVGFAYVLDTDDGLWAINGHQEPHSTDVPQWHAERILADGTCIQAIDAESERELVIAATNVLVKDTGVTEISVSTVEFHLLLDEPDNPPPGTDCISEVAHIFDTA